MAEDFPLGRFVWHDLMTSAPADSIDFYTRLLGWGTTPFEGADPPYTMWTHDGTPLGGVVQLPPDAPAPPHWLAYVAVPDVDATADQAVGLGGQVIHQPCDIPEVGRFAVISDPEAAMIALYTPGDEPSGDDEPPGVGQFSWHELATADYEAAFEFYTALFGWKMTELADIGEMGKYLMYGRTDIPVGGMFNKPDEMPAGWLHYARVADVHRVAGSVQELGGKVLNGPMEVPGGDVVAQCLDPQGAPFALHHSAG